MSTEQAVIPSLVCAGVPLGSMASAVRQVLILLLGTGGIPRQDLTLHVLYLTSQNRLQGGNVWRGMPAALRLHRQRALRPGHGALPVPPRENWPQVWLR